MIQFKESSDKELFFSLHPLLIMIAMDAVWYAKQTFGVDLIITQTITNEEIDNRLNRVSDAHRTNRAIDFRSLNLLDVQIKELVNYINNKPEYLKYHYVSNDGDRRLMLYHVGNEEHLHLAIHKRYSK